MRTAQKLAAGVKRKWKWMAAALLAREMDGGGCGGGGGEIRLAAEPSIPRAFP